MAVLKERILQIGEGRFLRGFIGRIADRLNHTGAGIGITVVKPREGEGILPALNRNSSYNLRIRGFSEGRTIDESHEIGCILHGFSLTSEYEKVEEAVLSPDLTAIVSNTTEAGIVYREDTATYPYFLAKLLYTRFRQNLRLPIILPCELIEHNGRKLREYVIRYASDFGFGDAFIQKLNQTDFPDTLVDSIVTSGDDETGVVCEPYYSWIIEYDPPAYIRKAVRENGLNILFTNDLSPYRQRKVAILNGAHTMSVMAGRMCGHETVSEMMSDELFVRFISGGINEEIIPTLVLPREETKEYAREIAERFRNPFLKHRLKDIALNSVPKAKTRLIPTILRYRELYGHPPRLLTLAVSALIVYYRGGEADDDKDTLAFMANSRVSLILSNTALWGIDLSFMSDQVETNLKRIEKEGMRAALQHACDRP